MLGRSTLAKIRVLDLTRLLPGPYLTQVLVDLGADVVKVEDPQIGDYMRMFPPFKDGVSARFAAINRGKRSIALDLKDRDDNATFLRLAEKADIVVESFRPSVMAKLGLDAKTLREKNSRLIYCAISGYGQTGSYAHRAGHDLNFLALSGVAAMGGTTAPMIPGVQIADLAGGTLWGLSAILAALFARERSGEGEFLDISITGGATALLAGEFAALPDATASRGQGFLNGGVAAYGFYQTKDGKYLAVAALEEKFWLGLNRAVGRVGTADELLAKDQAKIRSELAAIFLSRTQSEWTQFFADKDVCVEPVLELADVPNFPMQAETSFASPNRPIWPIGERGNENAPLLGQHREQILASWL